MCTSKDIALYVIGQIGTGGGTGFVIEFCGTAIEALSMEARMSLCNMSIEAGARAGLIAPDDKTFEYLKACHSTNTHLFSVVGHKRLCVATVDALVLRLKCDSHLACLIAGLGRDCRAVTACWNKSASCRINWPYYM